MPNRSSVFSIFIIIATCFNCITFIRAESKLYYGQRIYTDVHMVSFVDPAKHGFHIILDEEFVKSYLQPMHLPTVYASAISLLRKPTATSTNPRRGGGDKGNQTIPTTTTTTSHHHHQKHNHQPEDAAVRVTKILYPEKGDPENGLLDGRTIKILGLQERTWYYVCVEFESNVNRHELATGTSCRLKRTLDKFGKSVDSTVSEIELIAITDRSIAVQLVVDTDFPILVHAYLTGGADDAATNDAAAADVPVQTFVVTKSQILNIDFGPFLQEDTVYGRLCILEEPLPAANAYTAMGRSVKTSLEHCYFKDLKTKPGENEEQRSFSSNADNKMENGGRVAQPHVRHVDGKVARAVGGGAASNKSMINFTILLFLIPSLSRLFTTI